MTQQNLQQAPTLGFKLIARKLLKEKLGDPSLSDTTLWRMVQRGELPRPIRISAGRVAWIEAEVDEAISAKASQRHSTSEAA